MSILLLLRFLPCHSCSAFLLDFFLFILIVVHWVPSQLTFLHLPYILGTDSSDFKWLLFSFVLFYNFQFGWGADQWSPYSAGSPSKNHIIFKPGCSVTCELCSCHRVMTHSLTNKTKLKQLSVLCEWVIIIYVLWKFCRYYHDRGIILKKIFLIV